MNSSRNITDLPLEVLDIIFKELPSMKDQISLAQVHPHIGLAFSFRNSHRFESLRSFNLTEEELSVVLPLCGSSLKYFSSKYSVTIWKLVEQHCPNLQSIDLEVSKENISSIKSLLGIVKSLTSIYLTSITSQKTENLLGIVKLLKFQPSLTRLIIRNFYNEDLHEVRNLVNLEKLIILGRTSYNININELCYGLKKLKKLQINTMSLTASKEFEGVPCPVLRTLVLWIDIDVTICSPTLLVNKSSPTILKWILSHAETLEELSLNIADYKTDIVVCEILSKCRNLRYFEIPLVKVDSHFAHRLIDIVSKNGVTSAERMLTLNFDNPIIHDQIRRAMENTPATEYIYLYPS